MVKVASVLIQRAIRFKQHQSMKSGTLVLLYVIVQIVICESRGKSQSQILKYTLQFYFIIK